MATKIDKTQRYIAAELTTRIGVHLVGEAGELFLVAGKQREGLTATEHRYLEDVREQIEKQQQRLHKLTERLRHA